MTKANGSKPPRVEVRPLTEVLPDPANVNRHTQRGQALVEKSLRARGAFRSIAAAGKGVKSPVVKAGSLTLQAAIDAGFTEAVHVHTRGDQLVVVVRDDIAPDSAEAALLGIEDNHAAHVSYDPDAAMLKQLADSEAAVLAYVNDDRELAALLKEANGAGGADAEPKIDRAAELQKHWQTATGQLWRIGDHRLLCGDCTVRENVDLVMGGEKAGAVVTDSPYGIDRKGIENDDPKGLRALFDGCLSVMPITDAVVINFQSPRLFPIWMDAVRQAGHKFERALWLYDENDQTKPWHYWLMCSQAILISSAGKPKWAEPQAHHDCYVIGFARETRSGGKGNDFDHASVKPVLVVSDLVSHTMGNVYDPFLGSGTTMVAAQNLSRRCFGLEISPAYSAVILQRMSEAFPGIEIELTNGPQKRKR